MGYKENNSIGYDFCYTNSYSLKLYASARLNALQLEEHKGRGNKHYDTTCKLCGRGEEKIVHFTIICNKLEQKRDNRLINESLKNPEDKMGELLFRNKKHIEVSIMVKNMWELRKTLL